MNDILDYLFEVDRKKNSTINPEIKLEYIEHVVFLA